MRQTHFVKNSLPDAKTLGKHGDKSHLVGSVCAVIFIKMCAREFNTVVNEKLIYPPCT